MNYELYEQFDWIGDFQPEKWTTVEGKEKFKFFMMHKNKRCEQLQCFLGDALLLDGTPESILGLSKVIWNELHHFRNHDAKFINQNSSTPTEYWEVTPAIWKSLSSDCALYIVQVLEAKSDNLFWAYGNYLKNESGKNFPKLQGFSKAHSKFWAKPNYLLYLYFYSILINDTDFKFKETFMYELYKEYEALI